MDIGYLALVALVISCILLMWYDAPAWLHQLNAAAMASWSVVMAVFAHPSGLEQRLTIAAVYGVTGFYVAFAFIIKDRKADRRMRLQLRSQKNRLEQQDGEIQRLRGQLASSSPGTNSGSTS